MTRAEFAMLLGASRDGVAEPGTKSTVITEADPQKFMAALAQAVAAGGDVFLADPNWGENERAQVAALRSASGLSASVSRSENRGQTPGGQQPATARSRVSGFAAGWLMIPTGGTSGALKFA